jgi:hypothetical protein
MLSRIISGASLIAAPSIRGEGVRSIPPIGPVASLSPRRPRSQPRMRRPYASLGNMSVQTETVPPAELLFAALRSGYCPNSDTRPRKLGRRLNLHFGLPIFVNQRAINFLLRVCYYLAPSPFDKLTRRHTRCQYILVSGRVKSPELVNLDLVHSLRPSITVNGPARRPCGEVIVPSCAVSPALSMSKFKIRFGVARRACESQRRRL